MLSMTARSEPDTKLDYARERRFRPGNISAIQMLSGTDTNAMATHPSAPLGRRATGFFVRRTWRTNERGETR